MINIKYSYLLLLFIAISCSKYDGPYIENTNNYSFTKFGGGQKSFAGNYFNDTVGISVYNNLTYSSNENLRALFTIVCGGGTLNENTIDFSNGYASTKWKSGTSGNKQQLRVDIINKNEKLLNSIYINSFAFCENKWDTVTIEPDISIRDILADTISEQTFMISNGFLHAQTINYFDWEIVENQNFNNPFGLYKDNNGTIYLSNWFGEIFKSYDSGGTWAMCTKPIPNHPYYYYMTVTPNGYIWASTYEYEYSLRCSRDGGQTWSADTVGLKPFDVVGDIFSLSNGDILFHSQNLRLYKSTDDGKTWKTMQAPEYSTKLYVTDKDEIIIFNQADGFSIHKSTNLGQTYKQVYSVMPEYGTTAMEKTIVKRANEYYILIAGYGIIKTTDFESFEMVWNNTEIIYLYMNHSGVLIANGFNTPTYYYNKN